MSEIERDEELVDEGLDLREIYAILNGLLATLDVVADFIAAEDDDLAERLESAMPPIIEVLEDLGGEVYPGSAVLRRRGAYLQ